MTTRRQPRLVIHLAGREDLAIVAVHPDPKRLARALAAGSWVDVPITNARGHADLDDYAAGPFRTVNPAHVTHMEVHP